MRIALVLMLVFQVWAAGLPAQTDSVRLSNAYRFQDGLYRSHAAFLADQPDISWDEVDAQVFVNEVSFQARLGDLRRKDDGTVIPAASLWGFSRDGVPYLHVDPEKRSRGVEHFAGLQYTGRVSYFGFPEDSTSLVTIKAYNPLTGKPFREGKVERTETYLKEFILLVETGEIRPLAWEYLRPWIDNDEELLQQTAQVREKDLDLIRIIQAYDRRNPFFMKPIE